MAVDWLEGRHGLQHMTANDHQECVCSAGRRAQEWPINDDSMTAVSPQELTYGRMYPVLDDLGVRSFVGSGGGRLFALGVESMPKKVAKWACCCDDVYLHDFLESPALTCTAPTLHVGYTSCRERGTS